MAGPIRISILANGSQARRELSGVARSTSSLGDKFRKLGKVAGAGLLVAGAAAVKFGADSVKAASDAEQSLGATESIFGKFAGNVIKTSEKAANAVGLSANSYRESANLLGALFKNQGVSLDKLSGQTEKHVGLAADLSAMYGGPVTDAVDALTAAYKGEFNQLEKYGVTIKQATINTEADAVAKRKYGKSLKDLTPKQESLAKQLATQELLFRQTTDAQGTFSKESGTLAGRMQRLSARFDDVKTKIGLALMPVIIKLADFAADVLMPALEDLGDWLNDNQDEFGALGRQIASTLLPVLKTTGEVVAGLVKFFNDLPGPIKELGIQVGIAALVFPRLNAALVTAGGALTTASAKTRQFYAEMTYAETRGAALRSTLARVGGAARTAAGVGGLVALSEGARTGSKTMAALGGALTGAALGATAGSAVFPGVGTAVGAVAGAAGGAAISLFSMNDAQKAVTKTATPAITAATDYAGSLDQITGAATKATRAIVLQKVQQEGILSLSNKLDINTRDLIGSVLGQEGATRRVNAALSQNATLLAGNEQVKFNTWLRTNTRDFEQQQGALRENNRTVTTWKQALKGLPAKAQTDIRALGANATMKQVRALARQYNLNPKRLLTRVELAGVNVTGKNLRQIRRQVKDVGNVRPDNAWLDQFSGDLAAGRKRARSGGADIGKGLSEGPGKARVKLDPLFNSLLSGINTGKKSASKGGRQIGLNLTEQSSRNAKFNNAPLFTTLLSGIATNKTTASSGGHGIGSNLGSGIYVGMGAWIGPIATRAAAMVNNAEAAARRAADSHSPSRKFAKVGSDMGAGLERGLYRSRKKARTAGQKLTQSVMAGARDGTKGIEKVLTRLTKTIEKRTKDARGKKLLKAYKDEYKALRKNGKAQDSLTAKIKTATDARKAYIQTVKDSFVSTGNIVGLGTGHMNDPKFLVDQFRGRVVQAERFGELIKKLAKAGLDKTSLQQLIEAGPEAGLSAAEALAAGGASVIKEVKALQGRLATAGSSLGTKMADSYGLAGQQASIGFINGLNKNQKALDKAAARLAKKLARAVRKSLGIRSPSRVFRDLGKQTSLGLTIGLEDVDIKGAGTRVAQALTSGFGRPDLTGALDPRSDRSAFATGSQETKVRFTLTADHVSQLQRGREIQMDLDAYKSAGGRARAS